MNSVSIVKDLVSARQAYYNTGKPTMSDAAFDQLEEHLRELDPSNSYFSTVGVAELKGDFTHNVPMLSQRKALTDEAALKWIKASGHTKFTASGKLDGISCSLHYKDGILVRAVTRGDGVVGRDITAKIWYVQCVPARLDFSYTGEIKGEIIFKVPDFNKLNSTLEVPLANPRNGAAGVINEGAVDTFKLGHLSFICFGFESDNTSGTFYTWLTILSASFETVKAIRFETLRGDELLPVLREFESFREENTYPLDGVVIRIDSIEEYKTLGNTAHHPRGAVAWKFKAEASCVEIESIEWSLGTAVISPVAYFATTTIDGAKCKAVSLKSVSNMLDLGISIGTFAEVVRSGGVIPWAKAAVSKIATKEDILNIVPTSCPVCGSPTVLAPDFSSLRCSNDSCSGKLARKLEIFAKSVGIAGLGKGTCSKISTHIKAVSDILEFSIDDFIACGISEGVAGKIHESTRSASSLPLADVITSLSMPGIGYETAKEIAKNFPTMFDVVNAGASSIMLSLDSCGVITASRIHSSIKANTAELIKISYLVAEVSEIPVQKSTLSGYDICITGSLENPRSGWKKLIEANGGKMVSGVSKNTTVLICNKASSSSKYKKATDLGIPIHNEAWLYSLINN